MSRRIDSFLLRVVVEDAENTGNGRWRGRVQHIGSGSETQFESVQDMVKFISAQVLQTTAPRFSRSSPPEQH